MTNIPSRERTGAAGLFLACVCAGMGSSLTALEGFEGIASRCRYQFVILQWKDRRRVRRLQWQGIFAPPRRLEHVAAVDLVAVEIAGLAGHAEIVFGAVCPRPSDLRALAANVFELGPNALEIAGWQGERKPILRPI
jgi:hypothetical protein